MQGPSCHSDELECLAEKEGAEAPSLITGLAPMSAVMSTAMVSAMMAVSVMVVTVMVVSTVMPSVMARSVVTVDARPPGAAAPAIADLTDLIDVGRFACDVAGLR